MKRYLILMVCASAIVLSSCGGGGSSAEGDGVDSVQQNLPDVLKTGTTQLDLSDYFFPFTLIVPDSSRGYAEVEETGYGETIVRVGTVYNMLIAEGGDLEAKKAEVQDQLMYNNTIVEEGDDFIIYKSVIEGSPLDPEFHFYAIRDVNGVVYEFKDNKDEGPFAESIVRLMMESVNHLSPNPTAS